MLAVDHVHKAYGGARSVDALRDICLEVDEEEFVCLLGPTGCGKTTLLNIVAGFEAPTAGSVALDGRPVTRPGPERGVVFQDHGLFPWLTVLDNVTFGPRMRRRPKEDAEERASSILGLVGLSGFENRYPHELSGGMRQRVAIARVLLNRPRMLLMDEPFGALDALTRVSMQRLLLSIWQELKSTVVFVTHDVDEAIVLATRIVVLSARPGMIKNITTVPFSRPRVYEEIILDDGFLALKRNLMDALGAVDPSADDKRESMIGSSSAQP